jgi:hypothetical protein
MTKYLWTPALQSRYNAIYSYLKNGLKLNINKDDYVEKLIDNYFIILLIMINGVIQQKKTIYLLWLEN